MADALFDDLRAALTPELVAKTKAVFLWRVTGDDGKVAAEYVVDLKNGAGSVTKGAPAAGGAKPDVTLTLSDATLVGLAAGKIQPVKAFMGGQLKLAGNMMLAQKLEGLFSQHKPKGKL